MIVILCLIGVLVGIISGLTGLGGGMILIPALLAWFKYQGLFLSHTMQVATNTSIAILLCLSVSNAYHYYQNKLVNWEMVKQFLPGLIIGIGGGSFLVTILDTKALEKSFAVFLFGIALHLLLPHKAVKTKKHRTHIIYLASIATGFLSPMFGIGGGILMIPFFHSQGLKLLQAIGSSFFCLLPVAFISLTSNTILGYLHHILPLHTDFSIGFIYWPGVICIAPMSMLVAPIGANIAKKTNTLVIKRLLAGIIALTALQLLHQAV